MFLIGLFMRLWKSMCPFMVKKKSLFDRKMGIHLKQDLIT